MAKAVPSKRRSPKDLRLPGKRLSAQAVSTAEMYRNAVEQINVGVSLISPDMRILALNRQMKEWFPHVDTAKTPLCYTSFNTPPRKTVCSYCPTCRTLQDGRVHESVTATPAAGKTIHFKVVATPVQNKKGKIIAAVELVEDITERLHVFQRMEEELDLNRKIIGASPVGIVIYKASGKCVSLNEAAVRIVGGSEGELKRLNFRQVPSWRESGMLAAADEALKTGKEIRKEVRLRTMFGRDLWLDCRLVSFKSRGKLHLLLMMVDLMEIRTAISQLEAALLEAASSRTLAEVIDNLMDPVALLDAEGRILRVNRAYREMLGYGDEIIGIRPETLIAEGDRAAALAALQKCVNEGRIANFRALLKTKGNRAVPVLLSMTCQYDDEGNPKGMTTVAREIAELAAAEESLRESEERYRQIVETAEEGVWVIDAENRTVFANRKMARILGYRQDEMIGKLLFEFMDDEARKTAQTLIDRRKLGIRGQHDIQFRRKDGTPVWTILSGNTIFAPDGTYAGSLAMISDISDRKRTEEALAIALEEKEVLLREVYHRSKNNMQIISSLLRLQSGRVDNPAFRDILRQNQSRIRSMALVHERLYRSGDLNRIDFAEYVRNLASQMVASARPAPEGIALGLDIEDVTLNVNTAIPCGLILNELILNSLKHAFPEGRRGEVDISLRSTGPGRFVMRVADNGVGFPEGLDFRKARTMGLEIINTLVGQVEGTIELDRRGGTAFTVEFREQTS